MSALYALAAFHGATREALAFVSAGLALSSLDGLAVDAAFFARLAWRRVTVYRHHARAQADRLGGDGGAMAILVPAWDEAAVIGPMLRALVAGLDYPDYRVFVGVYPNDPATQAEVAGVRDQCITIVTCTRPGPTTKADCLNHLWRAAVADETRGIM
ncbi:glycosyltransferase [Sphingosinicellaceae bacterium]|nr:glycosyltransferase [Sphingosinicellaceae bacterium]